MMDALAIEAAEAAVHCGYPAGRGRGAGHRARRAHASRSRRSSPRSSRSPCAGDAFEIRIAADAAERALIWKGRKSAFAAVGRISPSTTSCRTGSSRAPAAAGAAPRSTGWPTRSGCGSPTCSTPATATCTRWCSSTTRSRARREDAEELAGAILDLCIAARRLDHRRARRRPREAAQDGRAVHRRRTSTRCSCCAARSTRTASPTRARCSRRRGCAASGPGRGTGEHPFAGSRAGRGVLTMRDRDRGAPSGRAARTPSRGVVPAQVVRPASVDEVVEVLRAAAADGLTVVPVGGRTKTSWAAPPPSCDLLLDTDRPGPGRRARRRRPRRRGRGRACRSPACRRTLGGAGQLLAIDAPRAGRDARRRRQRQRLRARAGCATARSRDLLIGVTVVLADGTVASAGGKVVKNVAGYDLGKLYTGAHGSLGVVVETIWRLHPVPPARRVVVLDVPDAARRRPAGRRGWPARRSPPRRWSCSAASGAAGRLVVRLRVDRRVGARRRRAPALALLGGGAEPDELPAGLRASGRAGPTTCSCAWRYRRRRRCAEVLAALPAGRAAVAASACTGVAYAALPAADGGRRRCRGCGRPRARHDGTAVVLPRPRAVPGDARPLGPGRRCAGPDAAGQGPVRPGAADVARPLRRRAVDASAIGTGRRGPRVRGRRGPAAGTPTVRSAPPDQAAAEVVGARRPLDLGQGGPVAPSASAAVRGAATAAARSPSGCRSSGAAGAGLRRAPPAGRGAGRRLRALRLLPADLPDVRAVGRGDGQPTRADLPDEAGARGRAADATRWSRHFDQCLGCMACVTACPSGVQYDKLIEATRAQVERRVTAAARRAALRERHLPRSSPIPAGCGPLRGPLRAYQAQRPARRCSRAAGCSPGCPSRCGRWSRSRRSSARCRADARAHTPAAAPAAGRVGLLTGCVQGVFFPDVNAATARVLAAEGCDVVVPPRQSCCGALSAHGGREAEALALRPPGHRHLRARPASTPSSSTPPAAGRNLKEYGHLLRDEPG